MPARAMTGWGGSLTFSASGGSSVSVQVRNVQITRQASEFDITAHGDTKMYAGPGRVKRGGSCEAYVNSASGNFVTAIEAPNLSTPATLVFTDSSGTATSLSVIITGADQTHAADNAAIFQISFVETMAMGA